MNAGNAIVIGASGGIGRAIVHALASSNQYNKVHAVSRQPTPESEFGLSNIVNHSVDSRNETEIAALIESLKPDGQFTLAVNTIGVLHQNQQSDTAQNAIHPEKKLEDITSVQLSDYFHTNAILPALWLKYLVGLLKGDQIAHSVVLSARVGSIEDNRLGGWYGYRASKAALNMLVKTASVEYQRRAKNVVLTCYHPGTVDTELSAPFQGNVKDSKLFTPEFTAQQLLSFLPDFTPENSPYYIDWQGKNIPW
ncbi:SDR family NAD(P)-dependent oxidoreductase [Aestuariibacter sp. AA17]|uniref:SDR family NAD(P)-dependent oxidoreductase n=1 Tax=Fluctibacter corallii TaxID=2984329 RepID=A0ABT3A7M0_9ALTE|nr:SDR family NAD(P)-dependent oxidoreductase [Aestuariibacter sp. AA17]MCV2884688.1 SDR family NAD(P)-dependent oxidoreductase [Aestuariibacter sp. AA17]